MRLPPSISQGSISRTATSRTIAGIAAIMLVASACTSDDPTEGAVDLRDDDIILTSGLVTESSCEDLLARLISEGMERVGPYGFNGDRYGGGFGAVDGDTMEDDAMDDSDSAAAIPASETQTENTSVDSASGSDGSFSGTNNQEAEVDEGDFVKTDGKRLVVANGATIQVIDVTGARPTLQHTIKLSDDRWVQEMFLIGDRALVMSQGWIDDSQETTSGADSLWGTMPVGTLTTNLTEIDLVAGTVGETITFQGNYLSGREVDGAIRLVVNATVGQFPFVFPNSPASEEVAEKTNRQLLQESTLDQWLPSFRNSDGSFGQLVDCDRMYIPSEFSGFGTLAVLTLDLSDGSGIDLTDSLGVLTEGNTIYASTERLVVATTRWQSDVLNNDGSETDSDSFTTALHSFDISAPANTDYLASGSIDGHLLNQFSMSEHAGHLRVAVTEGPPWGERSESAVVVLKEQGSELVTVGKVGGLGKGEQIQAVRFMGEVGYVVTFRQVDPLYTIDLSNPTDPTVLGELKIPGFSSYLHPIGNGQMIGVGQDGTEDGRTLGAQVSLFNVSDLANPTRTDALAFGENSNSGVAWEAKAFTWWAPSRTAFVPVNAWNWSEDDGESNSADVIAVQVSENGSLAEIGRISHPVIKDCEEYYDDVIEVEPAPPVANDDAEDNAESNTVDAESSFVQENVQEAVPESYCWSYQPEIRRTVIIGDSIFTISDNGVMSSALDGFAEQTWIDFTS